VSANQDIRKLLELARPAFDRMRLESLRLARLREWRAAAALYARWRAEQLAGSRKRNKCSGRGRIPARVEATVHQSTIWHFATLMRRTHALDERPTYVPPF